MAFIEDIIFPTNISRGSSGGPGFRHHVFEGDAGDIQTISRWPRERRTYNVRYGVREYADLRTVHNLYLAVGGLSSGFRYQDIFDWTTALDGRSAPDDEDAVIGTGDGTLKNFQLVKTYTVGTTTHTRNIEKPIAGSVVVALDGTPQTVTTHYTLDASTGIVSFVTAPGVGVSITAGCQFHVPVQFGASLDSLLNISLDRFESGNIPDIPLVEMVGNAATPKQPFRGGGSTQIVTDHTIYDYAFGHMVTWIPNSASKYVILPAIADLPGGGPIFHFHNGHGTNSLDFRDRETGSLSFSLAADVGALVGIRTTGSTNTWIAFSATVTT